MKKKKVLSVLQVIGALLVALLMLLPLIYGVSTSFKTEKEIYKFRPIFCLSSHRLRAIGRC